MCLPPSDLQSRPCPVFHSGPAASADLMTLHGERHEGLHKQLSSSRKKPDWSPLVSSSCSMCFIVLSPSDGNSHIHYCRPYMPISSPWQNEIVLKRRYILYNLNFSLTFYLYPCWLWHCAGMYILEVTITEKHVTHQRPFPDERWVIGRRLQSWKGKDIYSSIMEMNFTIHYREDWWHDF